MIRALLLDDEPLALRQMESYASKVDDMVVVGACISAARAAPLAEQADVIFADIDMPDMNGLDFVRDLRNSPLVVFTTAHAKYAVEGFRLRAVDYLLKPFSFDEFLVAVARVRHILHIERAACGISPSGVLRFKTDHKTVTVPLESIIYIESMSEYVKIHLEGHEFPHVILYSLKNLVQQLPASHFIRIHRSYIISAVRIRSANTSSVELDGGTVLPVGESYRQAFRDFMATR